MSKYFLCIGILTLLFLTPVYGQETIKTDSIPYFLKDTSKYFISAININSQNSEYAPVLINGKMLFASDRNDLIGVVYTNVNEKPLVDLYICDRIDSINFKPATTFSKIINTAFNDGPACFNKDGNMIIFSSNSNYKFSLKQESKIQKNLQLFQSYFKNNAWTQPVKLPFCKSEFSFTHPYFSADGKTLFFSSNIKGGYGGMDLYYSKWDEGVWSDPVNLGSKINSSFNEVFPFVSSSDILYYSSNISDGYGGLDLFSFDLTDSAHSKKHLLPTPINSSSDDFGVFIDSTGNQGYFSSNRNELNKDDIFYFINKYPDIKNCVPFKSPSYCYTFYEESSENTISDNQDTKLIYEWNLGDGTKVKNIEARHCFKSPGTYNVELNIIEEASGALFYNEASYEFTVEDSEQVYINCPDTVALNSTININSDRSKISGTTILSYNWNFGDGNYSSGVSGDYQYKKEGAYPIQLGIRYKNNSSGIVKEMCVEKKIFVVPSTWKKIDNNAYSAPKNKKIIYSSENVDSLNFRVYLGSSEKQIPKDANLFNGLSDVKESKKDSLYIYTSGKKDKALDLTAEYKQAKENGFVNARVIAYSGDSLIQNIGKLLDVRIYDGVIDLKNNNTTFKEFSSNIYFGAYADSIQDKYFPTLDFIAEMLKKQSELSISIYAFSDTVGSAEFSEDVFEQARLELSLKRGIAIKKYFEAKGLKIANIKNIPKGEHLPDDNRENLGNMSTNALYNRRVTIYVSKKKS